MNAEKIVRRYQYGGKSKMCDVLYFPEANLATVCREVPDTFPAEYEIVREGMGLEEIRRFFSKKNGEINLALLVRSIIFEAYRKDAADREQNNVRHVWYTHIKYVVVDVLKFVPDDSVDSTVSTAWGKLINSGLITYEGFNIRPDTDDTRLSVVKDSPFSNIIVAMEKKKDFHDFEWIPRLFNNTLITSGGQPSRASARAFVHELSELGVNLDQTFYMCVASDLDPAGYYIQEAYRKQIESAIRYYGGRGQLKVIRLFVRKNQVTENLLQHAAMPCMDNLPAPGSSKRSTKRYETAKKREDTKWEYFVEQTNGGLYKPVPPAWEGRTFCPKCHKEYGFCACGAPESIRALLEMNVFNKERVQKAVIEALIEIIEKISDESKIMIPEIMRVLEVMRDEVVDEVYREQREKLIQPLIDEFLEQTEEWEGEIEQQYIKEETKAYNEYEEELREIDNKFRKLINVEKERAEAKEPELHERKNEIEAEIERLEEELENVTEEIEDQCSEIFEKIDELQDAKAEEKLPFKEAYDKQVAELDLIREFRMERLEFFRNEQSGVFNPIESALRRDVKDVLDPDTVQFFFRDIEFEPQIIQHIVKLVTHPEELLEARMSCFEHPAPAFKQQGLLEAAAEERYMNIGPVRESFTDKFLDDMKDLFRGSYEGLDFEVKGEVEEKDLTTLIESAKKETETMIERGAYGDSEENGR